jgi:peptidoglycan/LPS O-acetylase OafA/YrhL
VLDINSSEHRRNNFDFIRILAALMVIVGHSFYLLGLSRHDPVYMFSGGTFYFGDVGLDFFFITSGCLVAAAWDRDPNPVRFIANRALRIVPGLAVAVLFCIFVVGAIATALPATRYFSDPQTWGFLSCISIFGLQWDLPGCFLHNPSIASVNGSLWSLPYEVLCYGVIFLLGVAGMARRPITSIVVFGAIYAYYLAMLHNGRWVIDRDLTPVLNTLYLLRLALFFAGGMVLCFLYKAGWRPPKLSWLWCIAAIVLANVLGLLLDLLPLLLSYFIYSIAYDKSLPLHQAARFGDFSYGLYIYAFPIQQLLAQPGSPVSQKILPFFLSSLVLTAACAFASWHLIEKRSLTFRKAKIFRHPVIENCSVSGGKIN